MKEKLKDALEKQKIIGYTPYAGAATEYSNLNEEESEKLISIIAEFLESNFCGDETISELLNDLKK